MNTRSNYWQWTKRPLARKCFQLSRWLHVYLSTALFSLLIFFSLTGITLNHPDWFVGDGTQGTSSIPLPESILQTLGDESPQVTELKSFIYQHTGLTEPRSIDMDLQLGEVAFDFPLPAGYAFVTLYKQDEVMEVEYKNGHWVALFNDLHKGRHTAGAWSWLIDLSALLLTVMSIAGLMILLQHKPRRNSGLLLVLLGVLTPLVVFYFWVPSLALE